MRRRNDGDSLADLRSQVATLTAERDRLRANYERDLARASEITAGALADRDRSREERDAAISGQALWIKKAAEYNDTLREERDAARNMESELGAANVECRRLVTSMGEEAAEIMADSRRERAAREQAESQRDKWKTLATTPVAGSAREAAIAAERDSWWKPVVGAAEDARDAAESRLSEAVGLLREAGLSACDCNRRWYGQITMEHEPDCIASDTRAFLASLPANPTEEKGRTK